MPNSKINILLVGVGGQGTILASKILAEVAQKEGYDLKVSEIHGMAQRGGSVVTQVKMGRKVYSPLIEAGETNIILAFEKLEALRWVHFLKPDGIMIVNNQVIDPVPVILGLAEYPVGIVETIQAKVTGAVFVDAHRIAKECGNVKASNVVLMGILAGKMEFAKKVWLDAIKDTIPAKFLDLNLKAFEQGWSLADQNEQAV